jgi:hypothetical protein
LGKTGRSRPTAANRLTRFSSKKSDRRADLVVVATWETSNRKLCKKKTNIKITRKKMGCRRIIRPPPLRFFGGFAAEQNEIKK